MQVRASRIQIGRLTRIVARVEQDRIVDGQRGHHRVGIQPFAAYHFGSFSIVQHPFVVLVPEYVVRIPDALPYHAFQTYRTPFHHVDVRLAHDLDLWHCEDIPRSRLIIIIIYAYEIGLQTNYYIIDYIIILTHDVELNQVAHFWRCIYLTFVNSRVPGLHVFDLQSPRAGGFNEEYPEPIVGDEQQPIDGEYVRISSPYPRHLRHKST